MPCEDANGPVRRTAPAAPLSVWTPGSRPDAAKRAAGGGGGLLLSTDDPAAGGANPVLDQCVLPGNYYIAVAAGGDGTSSGDYTLSVKFTPATNPYFPLGEAFTPVTVGPAPIALATADLNRDGYVDVVFAFSGGSPSP